MSKLEDLRSNAALCGMHGVGRDAQQAAQVALRKARRQQPEDHEGADERQHARVGEAQGRHVLPANYLGRRQLAGRRRADRAPRRA